MCKLFAHAREAEHPLNTITVTKYSLLRLVTAPPSLSCIKTSLVSRCDFRALSVRISARGD